MTLICYDSRTENGYELADKELAVLIAEVSHNQPQIVVILDCCHSGGLSRNSTTVGRWFRSSNRSRLLSSYLFASKSINNLFPSANFDRSKSNWLSGLSGDYILLAACRSNEVAREYYCGEDRGIFSYFLTDTLYRTNHRARYRDIFNRTNILVRTYNPSQSPQSIVTNSDYLDRPFLGESNDQQHSYFTIYHHQDYGWVIDGGLVHGIQSNSETERTRLAVFPLDVEDIRQLSLAIARAETIKVLPQLSQLNITDEKKPLNTELTYKAVVTGIPLPPVGIYLAGEASAMNLARHAIQTASFGEQPSLYLHEVVESVAEFQLDCKERYTIVRQGSDRAEATTENAIQAIQCLEHIARWMNIAALSSPPTSQIPANALQIQVYYPDRDIEINEPEIRLEYKNINDHWIPPAFRVKLTNHSHQLLYCTLLNLTQLYAIRPIPLNGNIIACIEPGKSVWALDGKPIDARIPEDMLQQVYIEYKDILKSICNTSEFDASLLAQKSILSTINSSTRTPRQVQPKGYSSTLERLMSEVPTHKIRKMVAANLDDDWVTTEVLITTSRDAKSTY